MEKITSNRSNTSSLKSSSFELDLDRPNIEDYLPSGSSIIENWNLPASGWYAATAVAVSQPCATRVWVENGLLVRAVIAAVLFGIFSEFSQSEFSRGVEVNQNTLMKYEEEEEEEEHVIDENRDKCNIGNNAENEEEEKAGTEEGSRSGIQEFIREEENVTRVGIGSAERNREWVESKEEEFIDLTGLDESHHDDMDMVCPSGKKRTHVGLKRKESFGLDFWVAVDNKKWDLVESNLERNRFGQFTSSHFDFDPMKKKMAFGEKELKYTPYLDDGHFARKTKSYAEMDKPKQGTGSKKEFAKYTNRWRKGATKIHEVLKVLADSLLDGQEMPLEDWSSNPKAGLLIVVAAVFMVGRTVFSSV